jgi:hypothetical protein
MIEEYGPGLPVLKEGDSFLMLHFRETVSYEEAKELVSQLESKPDLLTYTRFLS